MAEATPARLSFAAIHLERPPQGRLFVDAVLHNQASRARWFLLPDRVDLAAGWVPRQATGVEVYALSGRGRAVVGHWAGDPSFQALLLPGGARVTLRRFPLRFWGDIPDRAHVEVLVAGGLSVAGRPAEEWLGMDARCEPVSEVDAQPLADQSQVRVARQVGEESMGAEVTVTVLQRVATEVTVSV